MRRLAKEFPVIQLGVSMPILIQVSDHARGSQRCHHQDFEASPGQGQDDGVKADGCGCSSRVPRGGVRASTAQRS